MTILLVGIGNATADGEGSNRGQGGAGRRCGQVRLLFGLGLAAPLLLQLIRDKLEAVGPAGPPAQSSGPFPNCLTISARVQSRYLAGITVTSNFSPVWAVLSF